MQFIRAMGRRLSVCSRCALGKLVALGVLLAVPTLGLARLSADLFASWQDPGAEEILLAGNSSEGLLAFDAPASTLRQHQLQVKSSTAATAQSEKDAPPSLLVPDFRFTQQPTNNTQISNFLTLLARTEFASDAQLLLAGVPPSAVYAVMLQQVGLNQMVAQDLMAISQSPILNVPMINGFLGNIVVSEFNFDLRLALSGLSTGSLSFILGQQLGLNEAISQFFLLSAPTPLVPATPVS